MRYLILCTFWFYGQLYAQQIDSVCIRYYSGFDCTYGKNEDSQRGACINESVLRYCLKNKNYILTEHAIKELFLPWDNGFKPNIIQDSIDHLKVSFRNRIQADTLARFLLDLSQVKEDTIFPYQISLVTNEFLERNQIKNNTKNSVDSVLKDGFESYLYSTVMRNIVVFFEINNQNYSLFKSENLFWILETDNGNKKLRYLIYWFDLDRFLYEVLPKNFVGRTRLITSAYFN